MIRSLTAFVLALGLANTALAVDKSYYEIKNMKVTDVTEKYSSQVNPMAQPGLNEECASSGPFAIRYSGQAPADLNPLNGVELIVDQIINIGKKIWTIVQAGKPVMNIKLDTANALPKGLTCWSDLSGWNVPESKVYQIDYTNGFGMNVVSFAYRVTYTAGGSANGVGKYITNATFMPANVKVAWGFQFDAEAAIPSVFNTGTKEAPVAGMQMNMGWKVTSPVVEHLSSESYFVSGENKLIKLQ
ncbi:hypothetical protein AZI86_17850 [Bdellovibrio bacteriovorus]|uniref:Uncharacterized protein n=1 Tax=Bdellovibrio bacteriovorus TaxID=959 RepID=A0A150WF39_BDEBC|nr:hypothetical protein [Bdellovibrio bacteriovorus]KYG61570.1 hypothetical protein AZI86_17850 [Bdellovibrio bacteriovorus]